MTIYLVCLFFSALLVITYQILWLQNSFVAAVVKNVDYFVWAECLEKFS